MGVGDRLGPLQMGVARQHGGLIGAGGGHQPLLQGGDGAEQQLALGLAPEFEVGGDLIVARAAGVQLLAKIADGGDKLALDPGVDVFGVRAQDLLGILLHRGEQHFHRLLQFCLFALGQHTHLHQRFGPGHGALNILLRQPVIEPQRIVELLEPAIGSLTEASTPKCHTALLECEKLSYQKSPKFFQLKNSMQQTSMSMLRHMLPLLTFCRFQCLQLCQTIICLLPCFALCHAITDTKVT